MVSPLSLYLLAATLVLLAIGVARLRRVSPPDVAADLGIGLVGTLLVLALSVGLFTFGQSFAASGAWLSCGSLSLLASPLGATLALRCRGRRSVPRALAAAGVALAGVILWLTLNLRGPRGGWTPGEILLVLPAIAVAVASAACLGWWSKRTPSMPAVATILFVSFCAIGCGAGGARGGSGTLELIVRDAATNEPTPARVELLDESGRAFVPDAALEVFSDCGNVPVHNWVPGASLPQSMWNGHRKVDNPFTGTTQFYADGSVTARLPAGTYSVRVAKGIEFDEALDRMVIEAGKVTRLEVDLERWIDLEAKGWYGADDHLHIPRPHPRFDPRLATWMQAEGLHVANLLQMGLARDVHITPQRAFGPRSAYQTGNTLILSGQENPRTHVLGHAIVLGADRFLDLPEWYLLYDRVWSEAHRQGAVNGYAHWGLAGAEEGLAVWGAEALLDFVEVLNLGLPFYDRWYEALDLGIRLGPTAGTDYPCLPSLPGRERFYARLDGPLAADSWLEAVRQGRTFVTNGPIVELSVGSTTPGDELLLAGPSEVTVSGRVRFDPDRDDIAALELIRGGVVVASADVPTSGGEIRLEATLTIQRTSWVALRARGVKRGETELDLRSLFSSMLVLERDSNAELLGSVPEGLAPRPSAAHTGAILITVEGTPPLADQPRGRRAAGLWLARLDELEHRLDEDRLETWARYPGRGDGIDRRTARANRSALLEAIRTARRHLRSTVDQDPSSVSTVQ